MKEGELIEVGAIVYNWNRWTGYSKMRVTKVTPKQCILNDVAYEKANRTINKYGGELGIKKIGEYGHYTLENAEVKAKYDLQEARGKLAGIINQIHPSKRSLKECNDLIKNIKSICKID